MIPEAAATSAALEAGLATHDWEMFEAKVGDVAEAVEVAIRAALEAAAPHMLAEVKARALEEAAGDVDEGVPAYGQEEYADWLRARAATYRPAP